MKVYSIHVENCAQKLRFRVCTLLAFYLYYKVLTTIYIHFTMYFAYQHMGANKIDVISVDYL